jgi:hypothetical protein
VPGVGSAVNISPLNGVKPRSLCNSLKRLGMMLFPRYFFAGLPTIYRVTSATSVSELWRQDTSLLVAFRRRSRLYSDTSGAGSVTRHTAPLPFSRFSAVTVPPWSSTRWRAMANPNPSPPWRQVIFEKTLRKTIERAASGSGPPIVKPPLVRCGLKINSHCSECVSRKTQSKPGFRLSRVACMPQYVRWVQRI